MSVSPPQSSASDSHLDPKKHYRNQQSHNIITDGARGPEATLLDSNRVKGDHHPARLFERLWLWEVAASILGILCLVSIIGVLIFENGRPLDDWRLGIAPTAVVSFLGTLTKSTMLLATSEVISQSKWLHFQQAPQKLSDLEIFDAASRGPYGAAMLMLRKHRHTVLASVAAFIITASILVDPFVQLVFSFPSRMVLDSGSAPYLQTTKAFDFVTPNWQSGLCMSSLYTSLQKLQR